MSVKDGVRGSVATLYRLADSFDSSVFQLLSRSRARAAAVVSKIEAPFAPWSRAARVRQTTVGQVRAGYISDESAAELATT